MPQMADITVKKSDGTTNIVYTALTPSSGDNTPAVWRSETAGAQANLKPVVEVRTRWNGPKTTRIVEMSMVYPYGVTDTTNQVSSVVSRVPIKATFILPTNVPDNVVNEAVSQAINLLASNLIASSVKSGFAPT